MFGPPDAAAEQVANDLSHELPSPYCPGRSISSCPSSAARKLEDDILGMAQQGQSKAQIEEGLIVRFGREKMGYAQSSAVFIGVTVSALLAIVGIVMLARRWARQGREAEAASPNKSEAGDRVHSQDELDGLEDDLDEIDGL